MRADPTEVAEILAPGSGFQVREGVGFLRAERGVATLEQGGRPKEKPVSKKAVRAAQRAQNGQG